MNYVYKAIILDFDGVILESLTIKSNAFLEVYRDYPEYADEIMTYHLKNGGVSRYNKFVHINNNILGIPITDEEIERNADTFSNVVLEGMLNCPFVKGAEDFLKDYSKRSHLYIASGTPEDELRMIVTKRGLDDYFNGVYGTPLKKDEHILNIIELEGISHNEVCFIGDAMTDYLGAEKANVSFIARLNNDTPDNPFLDMDMVKVNDLDELSTLLEGDV